MARSNPSSKAVPASGTRAASANKPAAKAAVPSAAVKEVPAPQKVGATKAAVAIPAKLTSVSKASAKAAPEVKSTTSAKVSVAASTAKKNSAPVPLEDAKLKKANSSRAPRKDAAVSKVSALKPLAKKTAKSAAPKPKGRPTLLESSVPETYGLDRLVAMPKDPEWTHLYWELRPETVEAIKAEHSGEFPVLHLRGFDTTDVLFDGLNAPVSLDIEVAPYARSWYLRLPYQGRVYTFEYGHFAANGDWKGVLRSQPIGFHDGMADVSSEEWISIGSEELFRMAAGLSDGEGIADLLKRLRDATSAGMGGAAWLTSWGSGMGNVELAPSSFGLSSWQQAAAAGIGLSSWMTSPMGSGTSWGGSSPMGIPGRPGKKDKDFWLWVETEIILYGATEPDAKVTLNGKHLQLNADGTFRLQFPFPDGTHHDFHVKAIDRDGDQSREARPAARRWTEQ